MWLIVFLIVWAILLYKVARDFCLRFMKYKLKYDGMSNYKKKSEVKGLGTLLHSELCLCFYGLVLCHV